MKCEVQRRDLEWLCRGVDKSLVRTGRKQATATEDFDVHISNLLPIPVTARSKAYVYCRSPAAIVGSNPTGGMDVRCECSVLSGRGLCDGLITRPEESYRLWRVVVCDQETSYARRL